MIYRSYTEPSAMPLSVLFWDCDYIIPGLQEKENDIESVCFRKFSNNPSFSPGLEIVAGSVIYSINKN